jgi:hypothetical protein
MGCNNSFQFVNTETENFFKATERKFHYLRKEDPDEPTERKFLKITGEQLQKLSIRSTLIKLVYDKIKLGYICLQSLSEGVSSTSLLVELSLRHCSLSDDAINAISEMLKNNRFLTKVFFFFFVLLIISWICHIIVLGKRDLFYLVSPYEQTKL